MDLTAERHSAVSELAFDAIECMLASDALGVGTVLAAVGLGYGHQGTSECAATWAQVVLDVMPSELRIADGTPRVEELLPPVDTRDAAARDAAIDYIYATHIDDRAMAQRLYAEQAVRPLELCRFLRQLVFAATSAARLARSSVSAPARDCLPALMSPSSESSWREWTDTASPAATITATNLGFMRRAFEFLTTTADVDQYLVLGAKGSMLAGQAAPGGSTPLKIVHVDASPVTTVLENGPCWSPGIQADLRDAEAVLGHPDVRRLLDFGRPLAVVCLGVVEFIPDSDDPAAILAVYRDRLPAGSPLVLSHVSSENTNAHLLDEMRVAYGTGIVPGTFRTRDQVEAMFEGCRLIWPGVVDVNEWRRGRDDTDPPSDVKIYGGVGTTRRRRAPDQNFGFAATNALRGTWLPGTPPPIQEWREVPSV